MKTASTQPKIPREPYLLSYRARQIVLAAVILVFAIGFSGWWLRGRADDPGGPIRVLRTVTGSLSALDADGGAICVQPKSGEQQCGAAMVRAGEQHLVRGQQVTVSVQLLGTGGGSGVEIFVVTDPPPGI